MKIRTRQPGVLTTIAFMHLVLLGILPMNCEKVKVVRLIIVKTEPISEITMNSCKANGNLLDLGESGVTGHGFCWSQSPQLVDQMDCNDLGGKNRRGTFENVIDGLTPGTQYYVWAYASYGEERIYGDPVEFTTGIPQLPVVQTGGISNVTSFSAQCEYNVLFNGGSPVIERGLCWSTMPSPTIDGDHTTEGPGTGTYNGTMEGLTPGTDYHVRPFAINSVGVAYGEERTFATIPQAQAPTVHTGIPEEVTFHSVVIAGFISDVGDMEITYKGFIWNTEPDTTGSQYQVVGGGPDPFELTIGELIPDNTYFVSAFAGNDEWIGFGDWQIFTTKTEPLVDERNGMIYATVRIGNQIWMAQNLDFGDMIDTVHFQTDNGTFEKYCYNNDPVACELFGGLYSWGELMQYGAFIEGSQGMCPPGWHIPSDAEWKTLELELGMSEDDIHKEEWRGNNEGGKLKAPIEELWAQPNVGATNETGFSAIPGGEYFKWVTFAGMGAYSTFWTSSLIEPYPWFRLLSFDNAGIYRGVGHDLNNFSVRCVKD